MMRDKVIFVLLLTAAIAAVTEVSAQRYPERRIARGGNKLYEKGDFEAAQNEYLRALETNPELKDARFNLAGVLFKQEKAQEAAKIYMEFVSDSTAAVAHTADANFNLGNAMLSGQKIEEALEFYKQALRLNPEDMQAKYNLAYARKLLQQPPPEDENKDKDQDQDQNQDQNDDEGDQDQDQDQDQNQDQNDDEGDGDQDQDQNQDQNDDEGEGDQDQNQDQDGNGNDQNNEEPQPDSGGDNEMTISAQDAQQMLEAIQGEEDKTREKMNAKEVQAVARSGKNW